MKYAVLLDFGSTYTKVVCVDLIQRKIVISDKTASTVHTDATIALEKCFSIVKDAIGISEFDKALKLSTSSAAGGLRIAVSGLTNSLSIQAGRNACFGAGGKVVHSVTGLIDSDDIQGIIKSGAEILLLCGGYENGNSRAILKNAKTISESDITIPVIYAGNSQVAREVRTLFAISKKECFISENIIPNVGCLNIEPTVDIIRNLFMERITNMKGIGDVKSVIDGPIIPTPAAVMEAGQLLYQGTSASEGIGPYMIIDIGGATTDVYSFVENSSYEGAKIVGAKEPLAKRTVEGDMGMRESSVSILNEVGRTKFAQKYNLEKELLDDAIDKRINHTEYIADSEVERNVDIALAEYAVSISARRHAGYAEKAFDGGCRLVQHGKNLTDINTVIGTGGILVNNLNYSRDILKKVALCDKENRLLPIEVETTVDKDYVFYAAGLLCQYDEEAALKIMKDSIK